MGTKGTEVMEGLLLEQWRSSPLINAYFRAFVEEFDLLFDEINLVYEGRFLDVAVGVQLDIIGTIMGQNRRLALPKDYFGFKEDISGIPATGANKMADSATPNDGGLFRSFEDAGFSETPLSDSEFRRVLKSRAVIMNSETADINTIYRVIIVILNRVPSTFELATIGTRRIELRIGIDELTNQENLIITFMSKFFIPAGVEFTIALI